MNGYGRLSDIKRDLAGVTGTALDETLVALRDEVSREFDRETHRHFYSVTGVRYFDGNTKGLALFDDDLISASAISVADTAYAPTTFENLLVVDTDYTLWPRNAAQKGKPYRGVYLVPAGQFAAFTEGRANIRVTGKWGYSETWEAIAVAGVPVTGTLADAADLSITASVSVAGVIDPGDMLKLGDEQVGAVVSVSTTTIVLATRGANGTTAAAQSGVAIYRRRYPADIENAVKERTVGRRWDSQGGHDTGVTLTGDMQGARGQTTVRGAYARWVAAIREYTNPAALV